MKEQFNKNFVYAEDKTSKKGGGVNAVLKLMSETIGFNDKLQSCIDAQDDVNVKSKLEEYKSSIEDLYSALSSVAASGIKSFSDQPEVEEKVVEKKSVEPAIVNAPQIPKLR
jgi:hypothetical protein